MNTLLQKISPLWALRLGLGVMYAYSGSDLFLNPKGWTWAVPWWFSQIIATYTTLEGYLRVQGIIEFCMALVLLAWFLPKKAVFIVAIFSSAELLFILLFAPQFSITFRDLGVFGASVALMIMLFKSNIAMTPSVLVGTQTINTRS